MCAGLLGLLAVALLSNVGRVRGKTKVFIGDGGNTELITAMRTQANFVENVPLGLLLIWLVSTFYGAATIATLAPPSGRQPSEMELYRTSKPELSGEK